MVTILQENQVTLDELAQQVENIGFDVELMQQRLSLHSTRGLGFHLVIDHERKFLHFGSYLPIKPEVSDALDVVNELNCCMLMGKFSLDQDNDLLVSYTMTFDRGLILPQFSRILNRFSSLIDHVVGGFDKDERVFALVRECTETLPSPPTIQ